MNLLGFMNHAARASDFLDRVRTIDFWAAEHHVKDSFASRYRLCRTAYAPKTRLVTYQDTVLYPEETHDKMDQCCRSYCRNPTSERKWQYNAATNKPRMAKRTYHGESDPRPIPGSESRISCAVAHWGKVRAREVLHRDKLLLFDADPGVADREWSLLEVRPPDVWAGVVITRALDRLDARSPLSELTNESRTDHGPRYSDGFGEAVLPFLTSLVGMNGSEHQDRAWGSLPFHKVVDGICLPDYQLDKAFMTMPTNLRHVSDRVKEECDLGGGDVQDKCLSVIDERLVGGVRGKYVIVFQSLAQLSVNISHGYSLVLLPPCNVILICPLYAHKLMQKSRHVNAGSYRLFWVSRRRDPVTISCTTKGNACLVSTSLF